MTKNTVSFSDFQKVDLRVGEVISAQKVEGSRNLIKMMVDQGSDYGERKILAGIADWYDAKDLVGKKFIFVANLEPKQMMKEISQGMILCVDIDGRAEVITVNDEVLVGTIVR